MSARLTQHILRFSSADSDARGVISVRLSHRDTSNAVRPRQDRCALNSASELHPLSFRSRNAVHAVSGDRSVTARQLEMFNVASAVSEARGVISPSLTQKNMSNAVRPWHDRIALTSVSELQKDTSSSLNAAHAVSGARSTC